MNRELAAETEAKKQPILSCDVYGVEGLFLSWWWSSVYIVFRLRGAGFALVFGFLGLVVSIGLYPRTLESAAPTRSGSGRGGPSSRTMPSIARVSECSRSSPMSISIVASVSYSFNGSVLRNIHTTSSCDLLVVSPAHLPPLLSPFTCLAPIIPCFVCTRSPRSLLPFHILVFPV